MLKRLKLFALVAGFAIAFGAQGSRVWADDSPLTAAFNAVVAVHAEIPGDARTAAALGTTRSGSGVVIDDSGLVLTIGYLILEAAAAEIALADGQRIPADIVAYDYDTGFGLLRALQTLKVPPASLGDSDKLGTSDRALVVSHGGAQQPVIVLSRDEYAGYWEYLLEDAIFTGPPFPAFSGAALFDDGGKLLGIGSLWLPSALERPRPLPGNMFVPINALKPILGDLLTAGRKSAPGHPWIGAFTEESHGRVFVTWIAPDSPAAQAGLAEGDIILAVGERPVRSMASFFRALWAKGDAGVTVELSVLKDLAVERVVVETRSRYEWLKLNPAY